jgi:hypothetical protein
LIAENPIDLLPDYKTREFSDKDVSRDFLMNCDALGFSAECLVKYKLRDTTLLVTNMLLTDLSLTFAKFYSHINTEQEWVSQLVEKSLTLL